MEYDFIELNVALLNSFKWEIHSPAIYMVHVQGNARAYNAMFFLSVTSNQLQIALLGSRYEE